MWMKERLSRSTSSLTVGQNVTAESSTSSVNTVEAGKRLSMVPESNPTIDVEQAIRLLQELKKTASPVELVALHKALLPTRDSIQASPSLPVHEEEDPSASTASLIRHRSMLPPGLATRGGATEDILRRQEDVPAPKKSKKARKVELKSATSHSSFAALDLADDKALPRATTPSENGDMQMGVYRHGTLRVTNGAASPEPSMSLSIGRSVDMQPLETRARDSVDQRTSQDYCTAPTTPEDRTSLEFHLARSSMRESQNMPDVNRSSRPPVPRRPSDDERRSRSRSRDLSQSRTYRASRSRGRSVSGIPVPQDRDESTPRIYKRTRPRRSRTDPQTGTPRSREPSQNRAVHSRDSSVSRIPLRKEISRPSLHALEPQVSRPSLSALEQRVSNQSLRPLRPEIDDGRVSPITTDLPRFAKRWSHRASQTIQDGAADSEVSAISSDDLRSSLRQYEDRTALLKRLSTVYDGEDEDATAFETPEAALSKLNGVEVHGTAERSIGSTSASATPTPSTHLQRNATLERPPMIAQNSDSGYGTDTSPYASQQKLFGEVGSATKASPTFDEGVSLDDDGQSLYTFDQVLKSPSLLAGLSTPSPRPTGPAKKHSSFLKLSSSRQASAKSPTSLGDLGNIDEAVGNSPAEPKSGKKKKLQKSMPASVKKERKAQIKKQQEDGETPEAKVNEATPIWAEMASDHARFSFEPSIAPAAKSSISLAPTDAQGKAQPPPAELSSDSVPLVVADGAPTPKSSYLRRRSKSRGRDRRASGSQITASESEVPEREFIDSSHGRSTPGPRGGNIFPKPSGFGIGPVSCIGFPSATNDTASDDNIPLWTDHASVSQALGCSPYDMSTALFKKTVSLPGTVVHQIQSPHQISTTFSRSKTGGLRGMDSGMASELARMKSRDVAIKNNEEVYDRPRMATPKSRGEEKSKCQGTARVPAMLEDRSPDRPSKPISLNLSSEPVELSTRPQSAYSESIPPMPELPTDVQVRVSRMDELALKRLRDSAQPTPTASERGSEERAGDSTISVADAVKKAVIARKKQEAKLEDANGRSSQLRPSGPRQTRQVSSEVHVREISSSGSEESIKPPQNARWVQDDGQASFPSQEQQQPAPVSWEQHAKSWRDRRRSIGESLGKPIPVEEDVHLITQPASLGDSTGSPAIVVSRHVTSHGAGKSTAKSDGRRTSDSAARHADAYRDLIGDFTETGGPDDNDSKSARFDQTSFRDIKRERSPGGRVITPSGNFHPYTPANAMNAQQSRSASLAKLEGSSAIISTEYIVASPSTEVHQENAIESLFDRYSGGFEFGYEKGAGLGGSAGTRVPKDGGQRKSKQLSADMGLDLSDVPVFLRKV